MGLWVRHCAKRSLFQSNRSLHVCSPHVCNLTRALPVMAAWFMEFMSASAFHCFASAFEQTKSVPFNVLGLELATHVASPVPLGQSLIVYVCYYA